jgi:hypothetical protein
MSSHLSVHTQVGRRDWRYLWLRRRVRQVVWDYTLTEEGTIGSAAMRYEKGHN